MEKSLFIAIFGVISILGSGFIFFFSLSPKKYKVKALKEAFLETEKAKMLLEKCLVI